MNLEQAEKFSIAAMTEWKIKKKGFFLKVIKILHKSADQETTASNEFEFSLIDKEPNLRVLHLCFWKPNLTKQEIGIIIKKRGLSFIYIFKYLKQKFNAFYNLSLFRSLIEFDQKNGQFPVQFGMEYSNGFLPKIKVYLSVNRAIFNLKEFCLCFNLAYGSLKKESGDYYFDAIGIDLLPDGKFYFKFYPLQHFHRGALCRIDKESKKLSVKFWERFPQKLTLFQYDKMNYMKLPPFVRDFFKKMDLRVSYLSIENKKRSLYFR